MALLTQYDIFEDTAITELRDELKDEIAKIKESHRATQKCLFGKNAETELNMQICRDFMEVFGTSLVELLKRVEKLEETK
jgi:hypothetical protein